MFARFRIDHGAHPHRTDRAARGVQAVDCGIRHGVHDGIIRLEPEPLNRLPTIATIAINRESAGCGAGPGPRSALFGKVELDRAPIPLHQRCQTLGASTQRLVEGRPQFAGKKRVQRHHAHKHHHGNGRGRHHDRLCANGFHARGSVST